MADKKLNGSQNTKLIITHSIFKTGVPDLHGSWYWPSAKKSKNILHESIFWPSDKKIKKNKMATTKKNNRICSKMSANNELALGVCIQGYCT